MDFNIAINILFSMALIIHVFLVAYSMIHPSTPSIKVYKKRFNEIDFPVCIKICATEDRERNINRHNVLGYKKNVQFFVGKSMFNESLIGWSGHTKEGSILGSTQGMLMHKRKEASNKNKPFLAAKAQLNKSEIKLKSSMKSPSIAFPNP